MNDAKTILLQMSEVYFPEKNRSHDCQGRKPPVQIQGFMLYELDHVGRYIDIASVKRSQLTTSVAAKIIFISLNKARSFTHFAISLGSLRKKNLVSDDIDINASHHNS